MLFYVCIIMSVFLMFYSMNFLLHVYYIVTCLNPFSANLNVVCTLRAVLLCTNIFC
jgi:hypothetical protein